MTRMISLPDLLGSLTIGESIFEYVIASVNARRILPSPVLLKFRSRCLVTVARVLPATAVIRIATKALCKS